MKISIDILSAVFTGVTLGVLEWALDLNFTGGDILAFFIAIGIMYGASLWIRTVIVENADNMSDVGNELYAILLDEYEKPGSTLPRETRDVLDRWKYSVTEYYDYNEKQA